LTINSLLVAAFAAAIVYPFGSQAPQLGPTYAAATIAFLVSFIGQRSWAVQKVGLTHAGGIVYQVKGERVDYCLVGPSKPKAKPEWLFPKGHIEDGEEPWETALREVREESGVVGRLICPVGSSDYELPTGKVFVKYYLMEALPKCVERQDSRSMDWFAFDTAQGKLSHADNQTLLVEAERKRQEIDRKMKSGKVQEPS
jgi:8-oxo-dGTP pyrophosphatase MutT (NUDIX family)